MKKFCIFCGRSPVSKTMEHVIPQWLIEYTGNPNRKVSLGIDWKTGKLRGYSFSNLRFPACDSCNSKFAELELQTKKIIIDILNEQSLSSDSFSTLLRWFDKVRIGLWLGFLQLNKNVFDIIPHFHIESRVDAADRMLLIYKASHMQKGIRFSGVGVPFFDHCPTCFGLVINQFHFINISTPFLFSRRLGLPYPTMITFNNKQRIICDMEKGKERILLPLIRRYYDKTCTEIYQPIISPEVKENPRIMNFYNTNYVKKYFDDLSLPLGRVLINYKNHIIDYSKVSGKQWIPERVHERSALSKLEAREVISFQNYLLDEWPSFDNLDLEYKKFCKKTKTELKRFNRMILRKIEKEL